MDKSLFSHTYVHVRKYALACRKFITIMVLLCIFSIPAFAISAGTVIYFDNTSSQWDNVYITITSSNNTSKSQGNYCPKEDSWLGQMSKLDGNVYYFVVPSDYSGNKISFFSKDIATYDQIWEVNASINQTYSSPKNAFTANTNPTYNNDRKSNFYSGTWSANPTITSNANNPIEKGTELTLTANSISGDCTWEYSTDDGKTWTTCKETPSGTNNNTITVTPAVDTVYRVKSNGKFGIYYADIDDFAFAFSGGVNGTDSWDTSPPKDNIFEKVSEGKYVLSFEYIKKANSSDNNFKILKKDEGEANYEWTWESQITVTNGANITGGTGDLSITNFNNGDIVSLVLTKNNDGTYTLTAEKGYIFKIVADKPNPIEQGTDITLTVKGADKPVTWSYSYDGANWTPYEDITSGIYGETIKPHPLIPTFYKAEDGTSESIYHLEVVLKCVGRTQTHLNLDFGTLTSPTARKKITNANEGVINSAVYEFSPEGKELHDGFYAVIANPVHCGRGNKSTADGCTKTECLGNVNGSGEDWYNNITDHTGNTNGGMLMVNCKDKGELIYSYTATNLCKNMYMTFSAWFANAAIEKNATPINTRLRVLDMHGAEIVSARMDVAAITPSDGWKQGNTAFFSGENTSLTIQIINNGVSGYGNDILIDDIVFMSCVPQVSMNTLMEVQCGEFTEISVKTENIEHIFNGQPYYLWQRYDYNTNTWYNIADDPDTSDSSHGGSGVGKTIYNYETQYEPVNKPKFRVVMSSDKEVALKVGSDQFPVCINYAITDEQIADCGCAEQFISLKSGSDNQTVCQNTNITNVTYKAEGYHTTGIGVRNLPEGLTATTNGTELTISGTPTKYGNYTITIYSIGETGLACEEKTIDMNLVVKEAPTLTLVDGLLDQMICSGDFTTSLQVEYGGSATGITLTGFPTGVTPLESGNTLEIPGYTPNSEVSFTISTLGQDPVCAAAVLDGSVKFYETPAGPNIVEKK